MKEERGRGREREGGENERENQSFVGNNSQVNYFAMSAFWVRTIALRKESERERKREKSR